MSDFPQHLRGLLLPQAYPGMVGSVELIQTHISWVLLTGEFAYKIKRPVRYAFTDQRSLERRQLLCQEELRLNRRFAPQLYIEVCAITAVQGAARIGGSGQPIEYAVKMRQFRRDEELDRLLSAGHIEPGELEAFGRSLAVIHAAATTAGKADEWGRPAFVRVLLRKNLDECAEASRIFDNEATVRALGPALVSRVDAADSWIQQRLDEGCVRECHGDLHTRNVVRQGSGLFAFDCLEFEPAFRWIDVAEEVAFLAMDMEALQHPEHAHAFLSGYLAQSGDFGACRLLDLYKAHRALVRAKVIALNALDLNEPSETAKARTQHSAYLECASTALRDRRPKLLLMSGVSGSGKTWLARRLAPILNAVHLRSDVERKRLAGIGELTRSSSGVGQDLYARETTEAVYGRLEECARYVLQGGYTAIVDATFHKREQRDAFRTLALELEVPVCVVQCRADRSVLESRILQRQERADDASEADLAVLRWQEQHFEPLGPDEPLALVEAAGDAVSEALRKIDSLQECTSGG